MAKKKKSSKSAAGRKPAKSRSKRKGKGKTVMVDLASLPVESSPGLPLQWVDRMELTARSEIPVVTLRFYSVVVDRMVEACRLQATADHCKKIADAICRSLDYYPTKPEK